MGPFRSCWNGTTAEGDFFERGLVFHVCTIYKGAHMKKNLETFLTFMKTGLNEQLQQQLEYTLLKPDYLSWGISKMQSDSLEERYAIKFCFKLGKMP